MSDRNHAAAGARAGLSEHVGYLLVLSRPRFWLYLAGPVVVGVAYGASSVDQLFTPVTIGLFAYFLLPANVFLYGINDVFDREIDAANPKKDQREARYAGQWYVPIAVALAVALSAAFVPVLSFGALGWIGVFLLLGAAYSAPPARLKTTPVLDSLSNGLYIAPGAAAYVAVAGSQPPLLALVGAWAWAMGMHTFSAIPDIEPDRHAGIRTTATLLGERRTFVYCGGCWLASALAFGAVDPRLGLLLGVYPLLIVGITTAQVAVDRAYWWFPAINTVVGAGLTIGGLWVIVHG